VTAAPVAAAIASAAMKLRDLDLDNVERAIACALMPMLCRHTNQSKYRTVGEVASVNLPLIMP
jgi:hypothetical protein